MHTPTYAHRVLVIGLALVTSTIATMVGTSPAAADHMDDLHAVNGQISFGRGDPALGGDLSLWVADANGKREHRLTTGLTGASDWSPDGRMIAFDFIDESGDPHLDLIRPDGTGRRALTTSPGGQEAPSWSPSGHLIAFDGYEPNQPVFSTSIWIVNVDGTGQRRVTSDGFDVEPAFSSNGAQIAFARIVNDSNGIEAVYVVNTDGTGLRQVVLPTRGLEHPQWSPDGSWIAYNVAPEADSPNAGDVFVVHPDGTGLKVLRDATTNLGFFKPRWSPDGKRFLSGCFDRRVGRDRLCTFKSDGRGEVHTVNLTGSERVNVPAWGPRPTPSK